MDAVADFEKKRAAAAARKEEDLARAELNGADVVDESLVLASGSKRQCFKQAKVSQLRGALRGPSCARARTRACTHVRPCVGG